MIRNLCNIDLIRKDSRTYSENPNISDSFKDSYIRIWKLLYASWNMLKIDHIYIKYQDFLQIAHHCCIFPEILTFQCHF